MTTESSRATSSQKATIAGPTDPCTTSSSANVQTLTTPIIQLLRWWSAAPHISSPLSTILSVKKASVLSSLWPWRCRVRAPSGSWVSHSSKTTTLFLTSKISVLGSPSPRFPLFKQRIRQCLKSQRLRSLPSQTQRFRSQILIEILWPTILNIITLHS